MNPLGELDVLNINEDVSDPILCDSVLHAGKPSHPAVWWAEGACGDLIPVCEARRAQCQRDDGWFCTLGCNGHHPYDHIGWDRIRV